MFSILYYILLVIFLIIWGIVISVVWLLTVPFDKKRTILSYTTYIHAAALFRLCPCWKVKIEGKENLVKGKSYVIVSNHQNYFDIPLLHMLKFNVRWIAKRELLKMPFVGHALLIHGDILLDRGDAGSAKAMFDKAVKFLKKGVSVVIFPEGTRSKTGKVGRFKEGAFVLAKKADKEILPIFIDGTDTAFKGWKLVTPHTFTIKVLPAVSVDKVRDTGVKEMAVMVRDTIEKEQRDLRPELYKEI